MASPLREPGAQPAAQYGVPVRGTWNSLALHAIPTDALYMSHNVFIRRGKLRNRPGLTLLNATIFNGDVMGAVMLATPQDKRVLALTSTALYELGEHDTEWVSTASYNYSSPDLPIDLAVLETSSVYVAIIAREGFFLRQWNGVTHVTSDVVASSGTVPRAKSVCIAGRRLIYLVPPHTVGWSVVFDHTNFPVNARTRLAQSGDTGICVRSLGTLSFVVYKERSIYTARAQSGLDETAFSFSEPIYVEGPAGVHAVVIVNGSHMYMTKNGRVFIYDGSRYPQPIADGLWLYLQEDIDPIYSYRIFGVYDYRLHTVTFCYPRRGESARLSGIVIINLPLSGTDIEGQGVAIPASFLGQLSKPCTMACEMRFDSRIDRSLLFTSTPVDRQSFIFDENGNTDDGAFYECSFQTALAAMPNAVQTQVTVETFLERSEGHGAVKIEAITSDGLENETGTIIDGNEQYLDLEKNPVQEHVAFNVPTRFFGVKYTWSSENTVRYSGAVVHGRGIGR